MAWTRVDSKNASGNTGTCQKPAGVAVGDVMVAIISAAGGSTFTPPAGWTAAAAVLSGPFYGGSNPSSSQVFYRVVDGTEGANFTWVWTVGTYNELGITAFRGGDASAIFGAAARATTTSAPTATPTAPSVTTTRSNDLVVTLFSADGAGASASVTPPTGETLADSWVAAGSSIDAAICYQTQAVAGASGTKQATFSGGALPAADYHAWTVTFHAPLPITGAIAVTGPGAATSLPSNHNGNITLSLVGTGNGAWSGATTFSVSGVAGWAFVSKTVTSASVASIVVSCPAVASPPAGATGTFTVDDNNGSTGTIAIATPTLAASVSGTTVTLTGTHSLWATDHPVFTAVGTPALSGTAWSDHTHASQAIGPGTAIFTDPSTGARTSAVTLPAGGGGITVRGGSRQMSNWVD